MERIIDTTDGEILVQTAYDTDTDTSYFEFYRRNGYDEEAFPWEYVGEAPCDRDLEGMPDDELESMYHYDL